MLGHRLVMRLRYERVAVSEQLRGLLIAEHTKASIRCQESSLLLLLLLLSIRLVDHFVCQAIRLGVRLAL